MSAPPPVISPELKTVLRAVKLGRCLDTLPERLALAKARSMGHAEFLDPVRKISALHWVNSPSQGRSIA